MAGRPFVVVFLLAMTAGLVFSSFSTFDFVQHLDRQVHDLHCSFIPGLADAKPAADTGCQVTLMSPYSSVLRTSVWGGLPISLPSMAVFAFLLFRGVDLMGRRNPEARTAAGTLVLASLVPVLASAVMAYISLRELDAACKLCIGIYASSGVGFVAALIAWVSIRNAAKTADFDDTTAQGHSTAAIPLIAGLQLAAFVGVPSAVYVMAMPDYGQYVGTCGAITHTDDPYGVMVPLGGAGGIPTVEVFDPLCPACRAFENRLEASGLDARLDRKAVLFPLDDECNWMVGSAMHPGACAISEAVLCAHDNPQVPASDVIAWAFEHQAEIRDAAKGDPDRAAAMAVQRFGALGGCVGSADVRSKLNKSLRWAVRNRIPVLTPQLYVDGVKLCDEDTDLGMDFALSRIIENQGKR